jgi:hypothetical protein
MRGWFSLFFVSSNKPNVLVRWNRHVQKVPTVRIGHSLRVSIRNENSTPLRIRIKLKLPPPVSQNDRYILKNVPGYSHRYLYEHRELNLQSL